MPAPLHRHACSVANHSNMRPGKKAAGGAGESKGLGLKNSKKDNFGEWYSELVVAAELISYYDVSGCYILRPWAYAMWEVVQGW
jgi:prolyl-tRNA synthetase